MNALLEIMAQDIAGELVPPEKREPQYPRWLLDRKGKPSPPANPADGDIQDFYQDRVTYYQTWTDRVKRELVRLRVEEAEAFKDFNAAKGDELYPSIELRNEFALAVSLIAGMDALLEVPAVDNELEAAAQKVEDFLYECRDRAIERHSRAGYGHLVHDELTMLLGRGRIATRVHCVLDDPEELFDVQTVDSTRVFPSYAGRRGLDAVVHAYQDTVANIIGDYDDGDGSVRKKLLKPSSSTPGQPTRRQRERTQVHSVLDYTDVWHHVILVDNERIFDSDHEYGRVPWVIQGSGQGDPNFTSKPVPLGAEAAMVASPDDAKWKDTSFITFMLPAHDMYEKVMGRFITELRYSEDPAFFLEQDDLAAEKGTPTVVRRRGVVNTLEMGREKPVPMPPNLGPAVYTPILQAIARDWTRAAFPDAVHGINDKSNVSGFAQAGLNASGYDKLTPWILVYERYLEQLYGLKAYLYQNFGHLKMNQAGTYDGSGAMKLRYRNPPRGMLHPYYEMRPDLLDKTGCRVKVSINGLRLQDWGPFLSAAQMAHGLGVITRRQIATRLGDKNYDRTHAEWIDEQLDTDPDVQDIRKWNAARETKDTGIIQLLTRRLMQKGNGSSGPGGGGAPGLPPTTAGISLPGLGSPPGPGSGPPGPTGGTTPFGAAQQQGMLPPTER